MENNKWIKITAGKKYVIKDVDFMDIDEVREEMDNKGIITEQIESFTDGPHIDSFNVYSEDLEVLKSFMNEQFDTEFDESSMKEKGYDFEIEEVGDTEKPIIDPNYS